MSKRTHFTTVTPLPAGITRETVLSTLHSHTEMIDLNPLVVDRHPIKPPRDAPAEEFHCSWYSISDKVTYVPGIYTGSVDFTACFNDLPDGLQTHIYAPMGLNMRGRWTLGGSLPGEPRQPMEFGLGLPKTGLWLREDVDMKCNVVMTGFVKKTTKKSHGTLVDRLIEKSHIKEADGYNNTLREQLELRSQYPPDYHEGSGGMVSPGLSSAGTFASTADTMKPAMSHHGASLSDAGSIRSGGGSLREKGYPSSSPPPQHPAHMASPYQMPPRPQSPPQMQQPYQALARHQMAGQHDRNPSYQQYPNYQGHPAAAIPPQRPDPMTSADYPAPLNVKHQLHPMSFTNELPGQEARTPVEMAGGARHYNVGQKPVELDSQGPPYPSG